MEKKKRELVVPGDLVAVAEEFVPGQNAFEDSQGRILASAVGVTAPNERERKIDVKPKTRKVIPLEKESIVLGRVVLVKKESAVLELFEARKDHEPRIILIAVGAVVIRRTSRAYVKNLEDEFKIGDIVKAYVADITPYSIELGTDRAGFGVIKAFCSQCRQPLQLFNRTLKCLHCGQTEKRKISEEYLLK